MLAKSSSVTCGRFSALAATLLICVIAWSCDVSQSNCTAAEWQEIIRARNEMLRNLSQRQRRIPRKLIKRYMADGHRSIWKELL